MVRELAKDAVHLKMRSSQECPLISVYEFCYAAGFGLRLMKETKEKTEELKSITDFQELKKEMAGLVWGFEGWESLEHGEKLKRLLLTCRITGSLDEDALALFDMGYKG